MLIENFAPLGGGRYIGARLALDEDLVDADITGLFKFAQMGTQIAVSDLQQAAQVGEVHFLAEA